MLNLIQQRTRLVLDGQHLARFGAPHLGYLEECGHKASAQLGGGGRCSANRWRRTRAAATE
jgi:hypothetical protein